MPDFDGLTYPNASEVPDGPGAFLQLIQSLSTRLNAITGARQIQTFRKSTLADLNAVAGAIGGDQGFVTSGPGAGKYTRVGASWVADDTGNLSLSMSAGWNNLTARSRRKNGVVVNSGQFVPTGNGNLTGTFVQVATLPAGCWPDANLLVAGVTSLSVLCQFEITTAGAIMVRSLAGGSYTTNTQFSIAGTSWVAAGF